MRQTEGNIFGPVRGGGKGERVDIGRRSSEVNALTSGPTPGAGWGGEGCGGASIAIPPPSWKKKLPSFSPVHTSKTSGKQ